MPRIPEFALLRVAGTGLAAMLLASCARDASQLAEAGADNADELIVTARRTDEASPQVKLRAEARDAYRQVSPLPAPPPALVAAAPMASGDIRSRGALPAPWYHDEGRDRFTAVAQNPFKVAREEPVSTFSLDVDTASYSFVRASLARNVLPQPAAVRTEEMINYFPYAYARPESREQPFSSAVSVFPSPFTAGRKLVRIGIRGYDLKDAARPRANLVFLIDTSGSMQEPNKLPLVKQSLSMLLDRLDARDRVAIVTYAGNAGIALAPTPASDKVRIRAVLERLEAGGSTAGAEGIRQAYALAEQGFDPSGVNRVMLATDGDFNVGITSTDELKGYIERERGRGVYLSVLGFGMGNYNDALMQALAQNGNGAAAYIDTLGEARKVLVDEATGTLFPIARDVKIQVEFNPATVAEYRLIGYETRMLNRDDFDNDKVDAGVRPARRPARQSAAALPGGNPGGALRQGRRIRLRPHPLQAAQVGRQPPDRSADRPAGGSSQL